ncbi:type 2C protein phosphatase PTC5 Ecym_5361 [Eremothecium cymbalariae DBVPG|uniref:PPM-type phosphatase domain-containing protein n=1 Tax=Eremothecium cymbalariae (strain CBS 270.75 / DBVPG 7215 / KCTC 17166 / NRRL Y-17582) TaxID=931890 RepID=I6NDH7_ERECY|nr:hypothetical protein Ecym_5361 [Eremothecium cymbalariae DBVPG\
MPPQFIPWTRAARTLSRCLSKRNFSKLLARRTIHLNNWDKPMKLDRELKFAIIGGTLVLTYSYMSNYLSSDTIKGIKQFSTTSKPLTTSGIKDNGARENTVFLLTENEVNSRLRSLEESYFVDRCKGVLRYDVSQLPSNNPIEDSRIEQIITLPNEQMQSQEDLYFFGIFDGHGGPYTSAKLSRDLVPYIAYQLGQVYAQGNENLTSEAIDEAITQGFLQLDKDIVETALGNFFEKPSKENLIEALPAVSGACSLLAMYDSNNCSLKVALAGDSRALLGKVDESGSWTVQSLTTDQTADNPAEVQRINSEHPNEPNCVRNGRVLGSLQPSRAFGDYRYKVTELAGKTVYDLPDHLKIYFRKEPKGLLTPPYVTAKPEITTAQIDRNTRFMVMASDGLFELLTNEEIAGLVIKWMEAHPVKKGFNTLKPSTKGKIPQVQDLTVDKEFQRPAFRYKNSKESSSEYLLEDNNVSTHLIRNALSGGGDKRYVSTLISIPPPKSRSYRDDLTVTVVFFGDDPNPVHEQLTINKNATTSITPKL